MAFKGNVSLFNLNLILNLSLRIASKVKLPLLSKEINRYFTLIRFNINVYSSYLK